MEGEGGVRAAEAGVGGEDPVLFALDLPEKKEGRKSENVVDPKGCWGRKRPRRRGRQLFSPGGQPS